MKKAILAALLALMVLLQAAAAVEGETFYCIWMELDAFDPIVDEGANVTMQGRITAGGPIERIEAELYDLRKLEVEKTWIWTAEENGEASEVSLDDVRRGLFRGVKPGEKSLRVTARGEGRDFELCERQMYFCGSPDQIGNISSDCVFECPYQRGVLWNDNNSYTSWGPSSAEDLLTVTLPEGVSAEGFQVQWGRKPENLLLRCYDAAGALLLETRAGEFFPILAWYDLPAEARSFTLSCPGSIIEELLVFEQGRTPEMAQRWKPTPEKWDLMLVSTHQDDELLFFGGALAWYAAAGREVGVVYMANCGALRYKEALRGLWSQGLKNYPVFTGLRDGHRESRKVALDDWGGEEYVIGLLVEDIRHYKPEVVLTHDFNGEYGHKQHIATAYAVSKAVEAAADPERYPDSAARYGVWNPKKLYIHLWGENKITMDWSREVPGFGGLTGMEVSRRGYDQHRSQQQYVHYSLGYRYPNVEFGLYHTTVGPDVSGGDFFENID